MRSTTAGDPGQRANLQHTVTKPQTVRTDHEVYLKWANDSIASHLQESKQILLELGEDATVSSSFAAQRGKPRAASAPRVAGQQNVALAAASNAPGPGQMMIAESLGQEASLGRARSARDLFSALSEDTTAMGGGDADSEGFVAAGRVLSVREFQRGTSVIKPHPPLPFPGPNNMSPGERKRATAAARAAGREKLPSMGARGGNIPMLADGVTTMLNGVRGDLGEIVTAPVSPFSTFDNLLDRLVDTPEACFVNPMAIPWSPIVVAGQARTPGAHKNVRGGRGGAITMRT